MRFPDTILAIGDLLWMKIALLLLPLTFFSWAQTTLEIDPSSEMSVNGTSSLHDWTSVVTKIVGDAKIDVDSGKIIGIRDLKVTIPVTAIKSGKKSMDKNTYEALKWKEHPEIEYVLTQYNSQPGNTLITNGKLKVAGVSKPVPITLSYLIHSPEKVEFIGEVKFNMTEFNVDPPRALLGSIKTGDEITIKFKVFFVKL